MVGPYFESGFGLTVSFSPYFVTATLGHQERVPAPTVMGPGFLVSSSQFESVWNSSERRELLLACHR